MAQSTKRTYLAAWRAVVSADDGVLRDATILS